MRIKFDGYEVYINRSYDLQSVAITLEQDGEPVGQHEMGYKEFLEAVSSSKVIEAGILGSERDDNGNDDCGD